MRMSVPETSPLPAVQRTMMFTKTETEYNMKSIRFLLLTITTMFIVIGIMMMILGTSVYSHYHNFSFFYESTKSGRFVTPSVLCVFVGLFLVVVSSFGFFGSLKQSTCLVNMYAIILLKLLIFKLVMVILAFTTSSTTLMNYINVPISSYPIDSEIRAEITSLQNGLNCCGGDGFLDYLNMDFPTNSSTVTITTEIDGDLVSLNVPSSCCIQQIEGSCVNLRNTSCKRAIFNTIVQNASVLGVLGLSVMFIMLLGIIFAVLLARCIRKLKSERAMMAWKIREQLIMARMEENKTLENTMYIPQPQSSIATITLPPAYRGHGRKRYDLTLTNPTNQ